MTGDLHDHTPNFQRCLKLGQLDASPEHFLILHEVIHGKNLVNNTDLSIRLQLAVCEAIVDHPGQIYSFLSNHDLAQVRQTHILKSGGASVIEAFDDGLTYLYGDRADDVTKAYQSYILSLPLAVRCANGVLCAHSLPSPRRLASFDVHILNRSLVDADYEKNGSAYDMVWGRNQNDQVAATLGEAWRTQQFVLGHQPTDDGWQTRGDRILILDSQHAHGSALPIDLGRPYGQDALIEEIVLLAGVM